MEKRINPLLFFMFGVVTSRLERWRKIRYLGANMATAKRGDTVKVHYTGTLEDGSVFDSSDGQPPIEFVLGSGQIIEGFEDAVVGMKPGETRTTTIPSEKAYGERLSERMITVDRAQLPSGMRAEVGQWLHGSLPNGESLSLRIAKVSDATVTLDANHPLAGRTLSFTITLVDIAGSK